MSVMPSGLPRRTRIAVPAREVVDEVGRRAPAPWCRSSPTSRGRACRTRPAASRSVEGLVCTNSTLTPSTPARAAAEVRLDADDRAAVGGERRHRGVRRVGADPQRAAASRSRIRQLLVQGLVGGARRLTRVGAAALLDEHPASSPVMASSAPGHRRPADGPRAGTGHAGTSSGRTGWGLVAARAPGGRDHVGTTSDGRRGVRACTCTSPRRRRA